MSADDYNAKEIAAGRLKPSHVTELTRIAQGELGLPVDGKCGPRTRAALKAGEAFTPYATPDLTTAAGLLAAYPETSSTAALAVEVALGLRGQGEEGGNNRGPFIRELGGRDGDLWCALFAGHCWREAHRRSNLEPPAWTFRRPNVAEPGARALVWAAAGAHAAESFKDPTKVLPGDLALWKRDGGHHVALVWHLKPGGVVKTIEGNVGAFPATVRDLAHDVRYEPHFVCFARPPHL